MNLEFFSTCTDWPIDVQALKDMVGGARDISRGTFLRNVSREEMDRIETDLGYAPSGSRRGLTMAKDWHVSYHRSTLRGCPAVYFVWSAIEFVFTDLGCLRSPSMGSAAHEVPALYHGTLKQHLPAILKHGIERGEGWGGAGTSGAFLAGTPAGALYWAKIAYQREHGEKVEPERFDRAHGHEADELLAILKVQIPDDQADLLRADEEQFEDVQADFPAEDWRQSLKAIGDVRFDGEIPPGWIVDVIPPSAIQRGPKMSGTDFADCSYACPAAGRLDFEARIHRGETTRDACRRRLAAIVDAYQVPYCEERRVRSVR